MNLESGGMVPLKDIDEEIRDEARELEELLEGAMYRPLTYKLPRKGEVSLAAGLNSVLDSERLIVGAGAWALLRWDR